MQIHTFDVPVVLRYSFPEASSQVYRMLSLLDFLVQAAGLAYDMACQDVVR